MDRCALFVDAGYVLGDGAMAVHGTRRRESVSWNYEGLLQLLSGLAKENSGLPLLRCYWYEATVEGRRSADHDTLADLPGVKLRLAKKRPGRREGVEGEIHRDLETLARNKAVSDALVVSADEDLAEVVADVQDLGMRVTLLNIAVDGTWTISRALRQECDDVVEINSEHLRPYVDLISGAEPHVDEQEEEAAPPIALRPVPPAGPPAQPAFPGGPGQIPFPVGANQPAFPAGANQPAANGHGQPVRAAAYGPLPIGSDNGHQPAGYDDPAEQDDAQDPRDPLAAFAEPPQPADALATAQDNGAFQPEPVPARREEIPVRQEAPLRPDVPAWQEMPVRQDAVGRQDMPVRQEPQAPWHDFAAGPREREPQPVQELYAAPVAVPVPAEDQSLDLPAARTRQPADLSGYNPGAAREPMPRDAAQIRRLPTRGAQAPGQAAGGQPGGGQPTAAQPVLSAPTGAQPSFVQQGPGQPFAPGAGGYGPGMNGAYSGPQPVVPAGPVYTPAQGPGGPGGTVPGSQGGPGGSVTYANGQPSVSLAEAVQSAHDEGQDFGASVARDAPALWLEAVLARKPRMPSDLEARLLQGSALPIDFLLHDEVRHALRRGFWDALEYARR